MLELNRGTLRLSVGDGNPSSGRSQAENSGKQKADQKSGVSLFKSPKN